MKAIICTAYGPPEVLKMKEIEKPIPKSDEVLIKIFATSAHIGDTRIRRVDPFLVRLIFGLFKPKKNLILGLEVSGTIEAVGSDVQEFKIGDEVFALTGFSLGGYAEYICIPTKSNASNYEKKGLVALKPKNLSFAEAATVPAGALTVLQNLRKANIQKGQSILINGASGSLGTYAIQLAKHYGAKITAVCSQKNFNLVKSLGAKNTIDYHFEDFTESSNKYDIVYDAVMKSKRSKCKKILTPDGIFLNNSKLPKTEKGDLNILKELIENEVLKPIVERTYPWEEIVEAHRYVDTGHKVGNVAIKVIN